MDIGIRVFRYCLMMIKIHDKRRNLISTAIHIKWNTFQHRLESSQRNFESLVHYLASSSVSRYLIMISRCKRVGCSRELFFLCVENFRYLSFKLLFNSFLNDSTQSSPPSWWLGEWRRRKQFLSRARTTQTSHTRALPLFLRNLFKSNRNISFFWVKTIHRINEMYMTIRYERQQPRIENKNEGIVVNSFKVFFLIK